MANAYLKGSERAPIPGAGPSTPCDPDERLEATVLVRRRARPDFETRVASIVTGGSAQPLLSREEFAARHGADPADFAAVRAYAAAHGLAVVQEHAGRRSVVLSGTVAQFSAAFHVQLRQTSHAGGSYRGRTGAIELPAQLDGIVEAVLGLDNRPQAAPHFRLRPGVGNVNWRPAAAAAISYTPLQIASAYGFAAGSGAGLYFAPNTDAGFLDAVTSAIHDTTNRPSVISISWGGPESSWTQQAMTAMDDAFQAASTMGVTVCIASGDNGSSDGVNDGGDHVDFPASSPFALACGGTSLRADGSAIASEVVWNDGAGNGASGGGVSSFFALPSWQAGLAARNGQGQASPLSKRGVPDVAGNADPQTGYDVRIDGTDTVIGGTSAVAPLWAGLIARVNQASGKPAGYLNAKLYRNPQALRDITSGNNGDFSAAAGWDACTGLGSPNGGAVGGVL